MYRKLRLLLANRQLGAEFNAREAVIMKLKRELSHIEEYKRDKSLLAPQSDLYAISRGLQLEFYVAPKCSDNSKIFGMVSSITSDIPQGWRKEKQTKKPNKKRKERS